MLSSNNKPLGETHPDLKLLLQRVSSERKKKINAKFENA